MPFVVQRGQIMDWQPPQIPPAVSGAHLKPTTTRPLQWRQVKVSCSRTEPSANEAFTPLGCRLRAAFCRAVELPLTHGILVSVFTMIPHNALSGTVLFGPLIVMNRLAT